MKTTRWIATIVLPLALIATANSADAQGKGKGSGNGGAKVGQSKSHGPEKSAKGQAAKPANASPPPGQSRVEAVSRGRGNSNTHPNKVAKTLPASANASPRAIVATGNNRGRGVGHLARDLRVSEVQPVVRTYVVSNKPAQYVTGGALAYALARGIPQNSILVAPMRNEVVLRNRKGQQLVALDDDRARNLGAWQVAPLSDRVNGGAPSFCRSGAGHPVWGRQWCLDKGFGLGTDQNIRWGTTRSVSDIIFGQRVNSGVVPNNILLNILGPVAYDRLALHAVTLGYADPLTGVWHNEATGPDVLFVNSGTYPVAELVDTNRDQHPELMLVALRPW
ncbi:MAG TPA: hypothetical protein VJ852_01775 [Gemmatimonadaceae bacterium]|nr:hypothetical protein [Gemmatimonadaceae bacterium]